MRTRVRLVKIPNYPSTSCGAAGHKETTGLVVAVDGLTFVVKLAEAGTAVIDATSGVEILTESAKRHGNSPWYWPPLATKLAHEQLSKLLIKYTSTIEKLQNDLGVAQRRVEILGAKLADIRNEP